MYLIDLLLDRVGLSMPPSVVCALVYVLGVIVRELRVCEGIAAYIERAITSEKLSSKLQQKKIFPTGKRFRIVGHRCRARTAGLLAGGRLQIEALGVQRALKSKIIIFRNNIFREYQQKSLLFHSKLVDQ